MSRPPTEKCSYHNSGYCKFSRSKNGCNRYHPTETCQVKSCKSKTCPQRHPKTCKYGEECRFQLNFSYIHSKSDPKQNACEEIKTLTEYVETLKKDIETLKVENSIKNQQSSKIQLAELEEVRNENYKPK